VEFAYFITEVKAAVVSHWLRKSFYVKNSYYFCVCRWNNAVL